MQRRKFLKNSAIFGAMAMFGANLKADDEVGKFKLNLYTKKTKISQIINDSVFETYARLLFPLNKNYYSGDDLENLRFTWYSHINADKSVEVLNFLRNSALNGEKIFFDIYDESEKRADPSKNDTGLFFFKGKKDAKFAICNAGGGFAYVGALHDSFPHALELSKKGYNAFALIYRPNAKFALQDLARAIAFIFKNAKNLGVDTKNYSLWGGSAGARMVAYLGSYGTENFGEKPYAKPSTIVMQYTGMSEFSLNDPPTYSNVGDSDYIANWQTVKARADKMAKVGIPTKCQIYKGLGHGFGLGLGTVAESWIDEAVEFWEKHSN